MLRGTTLIQPQKGALFTLITGQPAETTPTIAGSHPQLQGEFSLFLYRFAATTDSLSQKERLTTPLQCY